MIVAAISVRNCLYYGSVGSVHSLIVKPFSHVTLYRGKLFKLFLKMAENWREIAQNYTDFVKVEVVKRRKLVNAAALCQLSF